MKRVNPVLGRRPLIILFSAIAILLVLALSGAVIHLITESWWFESVSYQTVFWTRIRWQVLIWTVTLLLYGAFLYGNYRLALWLTREYSWRLLENRHLSPAAEELPRYIAIAFILLMALDAAMESAAAWDNILKFLNPTSFERLDPLFQQDISFYIFRLPIYHALQGALAELLIWALVLAIGVYLLKGEIRPERGWKAVVKANFLQLSIGA